MKNPEQRGVKLVLLRKHVMNSSKSNMPDSEAERGDQLKFAKLVGLDYTNYCKYEKGQKLPSYESLVRVAIKCHVELEYFANDQSPEDALALFKLRDVFYQLYKATDGELILNGIKVVTDALGLKDAIANRKAPNDHNPSD